MKKRVKSRNTPTRTYCSRFNSTENSVEKSLTLSESFSWQLSPHFTVHLQYMYTCIVGRESTLTASWIVVLETALRQRLLWDSCSRKSIVAFTQGHDVFVALPTGFGKSLCYCYLPYVFRGFTNGSIAVVVSPLKRKTRLLTVLV